MTVLEGVSIILAVLPQNHRPVENWHLHAGALVQPAHHVICGTLIVPQGFAQAHELLQVFRAWSKCRIALVVIRKIERLPDHANRLLQWRLARFHGGDRTPSSAPTARRPPTQSAGDRGVQKPLEDGHAALWAFALDIRQRLPGRLEPAREAPLSAGTCRF